jgi:hypothetical protein
MNHLSHVNFLAENTGTMKTIHREMEQFFTQQYINLEQNPPEYKLRRDGTVFVMIQRWYSVESDSFKERKALFLGNYNFVMMDGNYMSDHQNGHFSRVLTQIIKSETGVNAREWLDGVMAAPPMKITLFR